MFLGRIKQGHTYTISKADLKAYGKKEPKKGKIAYGTAQCHVQFPNQSQLQDFERAVLIRWKNKILKDLSVNMYSSKLTFFMEWS